MSNSPNRSIDFVSPLIAAVSTSGKTLIEITNESADTIEITGFNVSFDVPSDEDKALIEVYRGGNAGSNGTPLTPARRSGNAGSDAVEATAKYGVDTDVSGTLIFRELVNVKAGLHWRWPEAVIVAASERLKLNVSPLTNAIGVQGMVLGRSA